MPRIAEFFGIFIYMYFEDHAPAHFHAIYGEYEALISIDDFHILKGKSLRKNKLDFFRKFMLTCWDAARRT